MSIIGRYHSPTHSVTGYGEVQGGMTGCIPSVFGSGCIVFPYDSGFSGIAVAGALSASTACSGGAPYAYDCDAQVTGLDGSHPMAPVGANTYRAADGTGYRLDLPQGYPANLTGPSPNLTHTITDADGIRYSTNTDGSTTTEDTNGNQIVGFGGSVTDTLGRVIPGPSGFPVTLASWPTGIGTADFSNCSGSLPIVGAIIWAPPGSNGGTYTLKFCFVSISEIMPPDQYFAHPYYTTTAVQLQSVVLPDGATWTFSYATDGSGNLSQVTLPTGGTISYIWTNPTYPGQPVYAAFPGAIAKRTVDPNDGTPPAVWQYHYTRIFGQDFPVVTQVTDPAGADTVHTFGALGTGGAFYLETKTESYKTSASAGILLKTIQTDYFSTVAKKQANHFIIGQAVVPIRFTTTWPNGQQSKVEQDYDAGFTSYDTVYDPSGNWVGLSCSTCGGSIYGQIIATREYGFGFTLARTTLSPRQALSNSSYLNANLLQLLTSTTILPGSGNNTAASTTYNYDEPSFALAASGITTNHDPNPPAGSARGNVTSISRWLNTTGGSIISQSKWFDTGELYQTIDPLGHILTHSYDSYYKGGYLTKTCEGLAHCVSATYDLNTGFMASFTDKNASNQATGNTPGDSAHTISYSYDSMGRMKLAQFPPDPNNGGMLPNTQFNYSLSNTFPYTVQQQTAITSSLTSSLTTTYDGLGRSTMTQQATPNGTATVDIRYDGHGRVFTDSNPYFSTNDPTYGVITTSYDALGRVSSITRQDGSIVQTQYSDPTSSTTIDEVGNQRRVVHDAFGRVIEVDEPPAGGVPVQNDYALMQTDGNFVLYNSASASLWSTGTAGTNASSIFMQDDGNLVLYIFKWSAGVYAAPSPGPFPPQTCSIGTYLVINQRINANQCIVSPHGQYMLYMAPDGNFYIYNIAHAVGTWGPGTYGHPGAYAILQGDGNLCIYDANNIYLWCSGTSGTFAERLDMEDDGRIIIYKSAWNSGTSNGQFNWATIAHPSCDVGIGTGWTGVLGNGQCFVSPNGHFELLMQADGNLVVYDRSITPNRALWSSATAFSPVDPSIAMRTLYVYDVLGNLICVEQHGSATTGTGCPTTPPGPTDPPVPPDPNNPWRRRLFAYDSLSRMRWASNPESGVITYTYDNDGNLLQKTSPAPNQTGTLTQTVSYCYDELHRPTGKGYGAQPCPLSSSVVIYTYDSGVNGNGHLTSVTDQAGTASYTYDAMGRLSTEQRTIIGANNANVSKTLSYTYNLDGSIKTLTYPSGTVITYTPWNNGTAATNAPSNAKDTGNGINYVTGAVYGANGSPTGFVSGSSATFGGITNSFSYNKRLQPLTMSATAPSQTVFSVGYDFHVGNGASGSDNGSIWGIFNYRDRSRDQTFTYDALDRLNAAQNAGTDCNVKVLQNRSEYWGNSYTYDAWGNLLGKTVTKCGAENLSLTADAHNWVHASGTDYQYDAAGNMTFNATPPTKAIFTTRKIASLERPVMPTPMTATATVSASRTASRLRAVRFIGI
jgi:YD repeat-containing protein